MEHLRAESGYAQVSWLLQFSHSFGENANIYQLTLPYKVFQDIIQSRK